MSKVHNVKVAKSGDTIEIIKENGSGDYRVGEKVKVTMTRDSMVWGNKYGTISLSPDEYRILPKKKK